MVFLHCRTNRTTVFFFFRSFLLRHPVAYINVLLFNWLTDVLANFAKTNRWLPFGGHTFDLKLFVRWYCSSSSIVSDSFFFLDLIYRLLLVDSCISFLTYFIPVDMTFPSSHLPPQCLTLSFSARNSIRNYRRKSSFALVNSFVLFWPLYNSKYANRAHNQIQESGAHRMRSVSTSEPLTPILVMWKEDVHL